MIVTRQEARRIVGGRKTQHRLLLSRACPDPLASIPVSYREPNPALGFNAGGSARLDTVRACHIRVLGIRDGYLHDATDADAKAEGFRSRDELLVEWGKPIRPLAFWILRFMVDATERPRFLSQRVVAGRQSDYVDVAALGLSEEPEAVDEATQTVITARAHEAHDSFTEEARQERRGLTFNQQVASLEAEARARFIDVRDELRAIKRWRDQGARDRQLERMRAKVERVVAA